MIRTEVVRESSESLLTLDPTEAQNLRDVGRRLASKKAWWGASDEEDADERSPTVLDVRSVGGRRWAVNVRDAVGVVSVGTLQLVVEPKIPLTHLLFLFGKSGEFPRLDEQRAQVATSTSLWNLIAEWFVQAMEVLLRRDLLRDYSDFHEVIPEARGRIDPLATASVYYLGNLSFACDFDEFGLDTPLNRLLKAAAHTVASSGALAPALRRRAVRGIARMAEVKELEHPDWKATTDRRTAHYADALTLARNVLRHQGRAVAAGDDVAWTFLIRTPPLVEAGIRTVLQEGLGAWRVKKQGRQLSGSSLVFNPDLVFPSDNVVADVKYKLSKGEWGRADLYQVIAFAEAYHASRAGLVRFRHHTTEEIPELFVGAKRIRELPWSADEGLSAETAAAGLVNAVRSWLDQANAAVAA